MTFQRNIPQPGDLISVSQDNLLQNFQAINDSYNVNHVLFNLAGDGKHKFVEMPTQTSDPAGAASEITLFSRTQSLPSTGIVNLWYKRNAEADAFQLTGTNPETTVDGHTFLPGGLLLQWGQHFPIGGIIDGTASANVSFPISFGTVNSVTVTPVRDGTSARGFYIKSLASTTPTGFTLRVEGTGINGAFWMAVGTQT